MPLFVALLAIRFDQAERATGRRLVGPADRAGGVVALMGIDVAGKPDEMLGAAAILVAAFGYAVGPMVLKRKFAQPRPAGRDGREPGDRGRRADALRRALAAASDA